MHPISAVIITKNEEANIERTIRALKQVADEVIVVDSFSTDKTAEISKNLGAKVFQLEWRGFGPQKNFGNEQAAHNFILALDADEVLDDNAVSEIKKLKETGLKGVYEFKMIHNYFGQFLKHGLETPSFKKRLFDKTVVTWNGNLLHEALIIPPGYPIIKLKGLIKHYSYQSIEHYLTKSNFYTTLNAKKLYDKSKKNYAVKMFFSPAFVFFKFFFLKMGFLDGMHGFIAAKLHMQTDFVKYAKLRELIKNKKSD